MLGKQVNCLVKVEVLRCFSDRERLTKAWMFTDSGHRTYGPQRHLVEFPKEVRKKPAWQLS